MSELIRIRDFSGGMNTEVSDALTPNNTMRLIQNMDTDIIGSLRVRKGTTMVGSQIEDDGLCLGLYFFSSFDPTKYPWKMATFRTGSNNILYYYKWTTDTWTAVPAGSSFDASGIMRFETFLDHLLIVTNQYESPVSWDGDESTNIGTTHLVSAPSGRFIKVFKDRIYIAGTVTNPDRIYYSSIPDVSGNITWDTANDWLDINPEDGQNITGLAKNGTLLLIFKDRAMYRWNGNATDADEIIDVGCSSQESIATQNGMTFFFNPQGVWATNGGFPVELSKPIQRWIDAIPSSYYKFVSGTTDRNHYYCSIGDVTVDGEDYENVVLIYSISSKTWTINLYPTEIRRLAPYIENDKTEAIMIGDDDGNILTLNSGDTDNGTNIEYKIRTKKMDFGSLAFVKRFSDIFAFGYKLAGAITFFKTEDNKITSPSTGILSKWLKRMKGLKNRGRYFTFELHGESIEGQGRFDGWEITDLDFDGYE